MGERTFPEWLRVVGVTSSVTDLFSAISSGEEEVARLEQIEESVRSLRADNNRNVLAHLAGAKDEPKITGEDAADLYQRLDKRFRSWTGMSLKDFPHA